MALGNEDRKGDGESALVDSMDEFKKNFNIFTEGSLVNFGKRQLPRICMLELAELMWIN